jgi:hypothetical protein
MQTITEKQYNSLSELIFKKLMGNTEMIGEDMPQCKFESENVVNDWINLEQIIVLYEPEAVLDEPPIIEMHPVFSDLLKPFGII